MRDLPPLILARNLTEIGASPRPLSVAHKAGSLLRIRHGIYVNAADWSGLSSWEQYRLRIDAVAETCRAPTIFSHHSAAATWDIPTILRRQPIHALTTYRGGGRSRAGVRRHLVDPGRADAEELDGLLVTSRIRTVLDLAAFVDAGSVADRAGDLDLDQRAYGGGLRFHTRRTTFAVVDVAHGTEGWRYIFRLKDPLSLSRLTKKNTLVPFAP